jgi:hypothetical protein
MPTAAKLVAALFFGALAWFTAQLIIPYLPEGTRIGWFAETSGAIGLAMGWQMSGARAGDGMRAAMGYGLTTSALIVFWGLVVCSGVEMYEQAIHLRYKGAVEALLDMVKIMLRYAVVMAQPDVIGTLVLGAFFGGWLAERTARSLP